MDEKRKPPIQEDERVALLKKLLNSDFDKSNVKIVINQIPKEKAMVELMVKTSTETDISKALVTEPQAELLRHIFYELVDLMTD